MTEAEWLVCEDPEPMLDHLQREGLQDERKMWLFGCVVCRRSEHMMGIPAVARAVETWEQFADGLIDRDEHERALAEARAAIGDEPEPPGPEDAALCAGLLRDIYGNPFRPAEFAPEWRTDTALALARTMYEAREFSAMPILADALQDAGCDNDELLNHCRDINRLHVRGCWVVELVLGKS